jgi:sec-independent protein translocase protein TatA
MGSNVNNSRRNISLGIGFTICGSVPLEVAMFEGLFQPLHLLVIFFIALLVFGPKKLPELGKGIGEGIRALKDSMNNSDQAKNADSKNTETKS